MIIYEGFLEYQKTLTNLEKDISKALGEDFHSLYILGSYTRKVATRFSDIDCMIISKRRITKENKNTISASLAKNYSAPIDLNFIYIDCVYDFSSCINLLELVLVLRLIDYSYFIAGEEDLVKNRFLTKNELTLTNRISLLNSQYELIEESLSFEGRFKRYPMVFGQIFLHHENKLDGLPNEKSKFVESVIKNLDMSYSDVHEFYKLYLTMKRSQKSLGMENLFQKKADNIIKNRKNMMNQSLNENLEILLRSVDEKYHEKTKSIFRLFT